MKNINLFSKGVAIPDRKNGTYYACCIAIIYDNEKAKRCHETIYGIDANKAELVAICKGLKAITDKAAKVTIISNNMVVIKCLSKEWQANTNLDYYQTAWKLMKEFSEIECKWESKEKSKYGNGAYSFGVKEATALCLSMKQK